MATFNATDKRLAMGRIPQTNYATATGTGANKFYEQVAMEPDSAFWAIEPKRLTNKGQGTGNRWATEAWVEAWDSHLSYNFDASSQNLGRHLLAAMGAVTTVTQGTGFKHTFVPLDTSSSMQLPSYTFLEKLAEGNSGINSIYPSGVSEGIDLAGDATGRIKAAVNYRGSGIESSGSGVAWSTDVVKVQGTQNYFYNTQANISIGPSGSLVALGCDLESWRFGYKNTLAGDAGYRPGCPVYVNASDPEGGVARSELLLSDSSAEFEFTIRLASADPQLARLKAQTPLAGTINVTGALLSGADYHSAIIRFYLLKYSAHVRGVKDGIATITITPEVLYSNSDSKIVQVELINNITSYTT